ncbi:MAG: hypothetical protein M0P66_05245 [Salinivirgaceae bacterium]|nr:hypothetical protein [Salinivirgaceae bacterium]
METSLIEKMDKSRYNLIKWLTIGWTIWFGTYIAKDWINNRLIFGFLFLIGFIGWILFTVNLIKYLRLGKKVNSDNKLKEALNNEMHQFYGYKSFFWGFWTIVATISILFVISLFYHQISALIVCEITLFIGVLSTLIAGLIYNRD